MPNPNPTGPIEEPDPTRGPDIPDIGNPSPPEPGPDLPDLPNPMGDPMPLPVR
ncbi:hypothetical protein [Methyloraptor flagellatus]|uniref:Uncharacterized protein n=1 Tax=Methyloraptor flagellatus TaxID=3162530 RepID=A0AAU7X6V1_9HYPH